MRGLVARLLAYFELHLQHVIFPITEHSCIAALKQLPREEAFARRIYVEVGGDLEKRKNIVVR